MLPLSNIKVLELTGYAAGPYACMIIGDLGADVTKVEPPETGEPFRFFGGGYRAAYFVANNRNKKSIAIDLKTEDGKEIMLKLMKNSDVFLENQGPEVADRLGLSYKVAHELNPRIIYCSIKGYGEGPHEKRPALDPVVEADSGLMSVTGEPDRPPVRLGGPIIDYVAGMYSVIAIMGALMNRDKTGKGENIEVNLFESAISMVAQQLNIYSMYGEPPKKLGSGWGCYQVFKARDGFVFVGVSSDKHWQRFCEAFGVSEDIKLRFATSRSRMGEKNEKELERIVADIVSNMSVDEVVRELVDADVPGAPVNTMKEVLENPHLKIRKSLVPLNPDPEVATLEDKRNAACPMLPIRASYYNPSVTDKWIPAQKLGAQTVEILRNLGYSEEKIADLRRRKVVWPYL